MLTLYRLIIYLALPVVLLRLAWRGLQNNRYFERLPERFGFNDLEVPPGGFWIHAVSVGEVNAASPLIDYLLEQYPDQPVTVTTMTPTGSDRVRKLFDERIHHTYMPYDYPGAVRRFVRKVAPSMVLVMETEIWPNLVYHCHDRQIPMVYTNVRLSRRSYRGYHRFHRLVHGVLQRIDRFAVQSRPDSRRLIRLGARPEAVDVTGSIKFDITLPASVGEAAQSVRRDLGWDRPVWIAGSTHEGEEAILLDALSRVRKQIPEVLLVLVPRHPERFATVARLCNRHEYRTALRSEQKGSLEADTEIYVGDTMGELQLLIAAGDVAFIGGSLVPVGGHNLLEASAAGIPALFGPHMFNFDEISGLVLEHGAGVQVLDAEELAEVVVKMLEDPVVRDRYGNQGRALVEANRGALKRICTIVEDEIAKR